jgi:hypothetical protein
MYMHVHMCTCTCTCTYTLSDQASEVFIGMTLELHSSHGHNVSVWSESSADMKPFAIEKQRLKRVRALSSSSSLKATLKRSIETVHMYEERWKVQ